MKNLLFGLFLLALFAGSAEATITWVPEGQGSFKAGKYTKCSVVRRVVNGDIEYIITCQNPDGKSGTLTIAPPEGSLSQTEADLLADCDRENDTDNEVVIGGDPGNTTNPATVDSVATGPTS